VSSFNESIVEDAALEYFAELGYSTALGTHLAPGEPGAERVSFDQVFLQKRLRDAVGKINHDVEPALIDEAIKRLQRADTQSTIDENARVHTLLVEGVAVEHRGVDGQVRTTRIGLIDFEHTANNDWVAVNQFTVVENGKNRRPDVIVFVNGIPLGLLELKNPAAEHATLRGAWNQVQTYRKDIPSIFVPNAVTVISDGTSAAMSSFAGGFEHYAPWKTVDGRDVITSLPALEVLIKGVFDQSRFLDLLRNFIVYSEETMTDSSTGQKARVLVKRVAGSSGTPRDRVRAWRWSSTPRRSCGIRG
jgi:type I restriction enzyme R subunit